MKTVLAGVELFQDLSEPELDLLAPLFKHETFRKGETIVRERELSGKIYLIECGVVEVVQLSHRVALLERGELFGETALVHEAPRTATAAATVTPETRVYSAEVPPVQALLAQHAEIAAKVYRSLAKRLAHRLRAATETVRALASS